MLLVPSAFTKTTGEAHWELLLRTRAVETQCYVRPCPPKLPFAFEILSAEANLLIGLNMVFTDVGPIYR